MLDRPKLRAIEAIPVRMQGREMVMLRDPAQIAPDTVAVSPETYFVLTLFDGEHSIREIQAECTRAFGQLIFTDHIKRIIEEMDRHLFLESDGFAAAQAKVAEEFRKSRVRPPFHAGGAYEETPDALHAQLNHFFDGPGGPRQGGMEPADGEIVAAIAPHIDFHRGGPTFAWCYEALRQACPADLFVIFGTAHFGGESPYIATTKDFQTPLGIAKTDRGFLGALAERCKDDLFADELVHRTEHSIEFQVVFLQHIFGGQRDFEIVPVLCGGFHECIESGTSPMDLPHVRAFVDALRETIATSSRRVCLLVGADLSHIGQRFGDDEHLTPTFVQWAVRKDQEMLERVVAGDAEGFFAHIHADADKRRICGFPSIYTVLSTIEDTVGRLLDYQFAVDQESQTAVSFASIIFASSREPGGTARGRDEK